MCSQVRRVDIQHFPGVRLLIAHFPPPGPVVAKGQEAPPGAEPRNLGGDGRVTGDDTQPLAFKVPEADLRDTIIRRWPLKRA
mmetsp:Transcript_41255/g.128610  ORF Transcript_41255/g.128610 Transcript_41255/m.128610 type:complete len:82 (-) Transcript_41255:843-1088(-)